MKKSDKIRNERKENKRIKNFNNKVKVIIILCIVLVCVELISMLIMKISRDSKITFVDTSYSIKDYKDSYLVSGSSNFKHSVYNELSNFTYTNEDKEKVRLYAEKAKLTKLDSELNVIFESTFDSEFNSIFYDSIEVSDGYIAVGSYESKERQLLSNTRDGLIVKFDKDGKEVWHQNYQVLGDTEFKKIISIDDGFIVVGQSIYENTEIGNHDTGGAIISKYDTKGDLVWTSNRGGNKSGIYNDVIEVSDGYIACGKDAANYGMLVKYDKDGKEVWFKYYKYTDTVGFSRMLIKDDKIYIASSYNVSDEKDSNGEEIYSYDACIFVYDLKGELLDKFVISGDNDERFNSLVLLKNKIIAVGYTKSKDIKVKGINYSKDKTEGIIVEFNYEGKILNTKAYSGSKNEILTDVLVLNKDNLLDASYLVIGYSNSKHLNTNGKDYFSRYITYNNKFDIVNEKN